MRDIEIYSVVFAVLCILAVYIVVRYQASRVHVPLLSPEHELPPTPDCFTLRTEGRVCTIEHVRSGMDGMTRFLSVWLAAWTVICATLHRFTLGHTGDGVPLPLWFALPFPLMWVVVAYFLLYLRFARKTFVLEEDALRVDTRLLWIGWSLAIPRETISWLKQIQDGGNQDSFPSWGLQIKAPAAVNTLLDYVPVVNRWGRSDRLRSLLYRLPYEQSKWLGIMIARWAGAGLELCPDPSSLPVATNQRGSAELCRAPKTQRRMRGRTRPVRIRTASAERWKHAVLLLCLGPAGLGLFFYGAYLDAKHEAEGWTGICATISVLVFGTLGALGEYLLVRRFRCPNCGRCIRLRT